jgi:hypothetical protein
MPALWGSLKRLSVDLDWLKEGSEGMRGRHFKSGASLFRTVCGLGPITINANAIEEAIIHGKAFPSLIEAFSDLSSHGIIDGKHLANFERMLAGWVLTVGLRGRPSGFEPSRVSTEPPANASLRRSIRLLSMIGELHKAGYQGLRIAAGMNAAGTHWRCHITHAANVGLNGWEPLDWENDIVSYSAGDDDQFFGWTDASGKSARQLALMFVQRFPALAKTGIGRDRMYVGWFQEMLGAAENGRLPIFFADYPLTPNQDEMPPPPEGNILAQLVVRSERKSSSMGIALVDWRELPPLNSSWDQIGKFALTYDGYKCGARSIDECVKIFEETVRRDLAAATLEELLTCLFLMQRQTKWNAQMRPEEVIDLRLAQRIVAALSVHVPEAVE